MSGLYALVINNTILRSDESEPHWDNLPAWAHDIWLPQVDAPPTLEQWQRATRNHHAVWEIIGDKVHVTYTVEDYTDEEINAVIGEVDISVKIDAIKKLLTPTLAEIPDAEIDDYASLIPPWIVGEDVVQGDKRQYGGYVYRCGQGHKTQIDWTPDVALSLWSRAAEVDPGTGYEVWKEWDGHNESLYQIGDIVWYPSINTQLYIATAGNNHWTPGVFGWNPYNP
jgi:hypothetical protein